MLKTKAPDVRSMLLALEVPRVLADMAIPFVWFIPGAVDPDSPSIIEINKAMQRGLRKLGYKNVRVNGILDRETARALDQVSGPPGVWMRKTFVQILGDIIAAMRDPDRAARLIDARHGGLGAYFEYEGVPPGPLPGPMVGLPPGPLGMGAVATDAGVNLEFGLGIRDKTNIVPIPLKRGPTFTAFKNLQRQINRVLSTLGKPPISEDGIIGSDTLSAMRTIKSAMGLLGRLLVFDSTLDIAERSVTIANALKGFADQRGASASANIGAPISKASATEPEPPPITPEQAAVARSGILGGTKKYLLFLALAGGVAWYATKKKGKGKGKPKKKRSK